MLKQVWSILECFLHKQIDSKSSTHIEVLLFIPSRYLYSHVPFWICQALPKIDKTYFLDGNALLDIVQK